MKAHIVMSTEPIEQGKDREALCTAEVAQAVFVSSFLTCHPTTIFGERELRGICGKCIRAIPKDVLRRFYYVILSGQDEINLRARYAASGVES